MIELNLYEINGKDFLEIDRINEYVYLASKDDPQDICVRKVVISDGKEVLGGLSGEEEFISAMRIYAEKYKDVIENL